MDDVDSTVETFKSILNETDESQVLIGEHCDKPYSCPFKETHCWASVPEQSIFTIPRLSWGKKNALIKKGIFSLEEVPTDYPLSQKQRTYVNSMLDAQPGISHNFSDHGKNECKCNFLPL